MLNIEPLKQSLKIEEIEKKSFGDNIADMLNPQNMFRYDLLEWYFHQSLLKELVDGYKVYTFFDEYKKASAFDVLLKQLFPVLIFQRTMIDYQWHYTLRRLEKTYPQEFKQFLKKLQTYEKYVLNIRKNGELYSDFIKQQHQKIDEKNLKYLDDFEALIKGKAWLTKRKIQSMLKVIDLDHTVKEVFKEFTKYMDELIDFPIVHELINMSTKSSIPLWFANIGATCRLNDKYSINEGLTETEVAQMGMILQAFNKYDSYHDLYTGVWDPLFEVKEFVSYYTTEPSLLKKMATDFTPEQQAIAMNQLEPHVISMRLMIESEYYESILKNTVNLLGEQTILRFRQQFIKEMTIEFIEEIILQKQSYVWLTLVEPELLFKRLAHKNTDEQLQLLKTKLVTLLQFDWSSLQRIGHETYCKYWEFLFEENEKFRFEVLSNPIYIVLYNKAQGKSESVWNWLKENAFKEQHSFTITPIVGLDHVLKKIGTTEQVNLLMAKWVDNLENFEVLREMNFTIMTGDEDGFISASTVLESSMFFELEDEMLTEPFENYQFIVKRIGIKSPDGTILRRAKIKAQLLINDEEDLDDWLSSLENL